MSFDLALVIINYNTPDLVVQAVESALATRESLRLEIIIIDNASFRGDLRTALEPLQERCPEGVSLQIIFSPHNLGFTGGNNLGLKQTTAPYLLLLNSDTLVKPGCLQRCVEYLRAHPQVGILGPKLLDPDGSRQLSCRRFPSFQTALFNRYSLMTRLFPGNPWSRAYLMSDPGDLEQPAAVDWVSGAAMFITRKAYETVGALDEDFFMYAEDVDYCLRVHQAGFEVHYVPDAEIVHLIGQSSAHLPFKTIWWRHRSMWTFYYKHYSRRVAFFDLITLGGIMARAVLKMAATGLAVRISRKSQGEKVP